MRGRSILSLILGLAMLAGAMAAPVPARGQAPKRGGVLNAMLGEDPPGFSIHESATISGVWPVMPCYSNLVLQRGGGPLIDLQSQELDLDKRLKLVWDIQRKLESDVARPMLGWRKEYFTRWPHVRNLVPHNSLYNYGRMQEVWLDR